MENELFEKAPVPKAYFTMALPVVMGMVVSLIYNMVDTFFIARTQNTNLVAGVSLCAPIFTLMIALGDIFGLGGSSVISRLFGEKREEEGKRVSGFCFYAGNFMWCSCDPLMLFLRCRSCGCRVQQRIRWSMHGSITGIWHMVRPSSLSR